MHFLSRISLFEKIQSLPMLIVVAGAVRVELVFLSVRSQGGQFGDACQTERFLYPNKTLDTHIASISGNLFAPALASLRDASVLRTR